MGKTVYDTISVTEHMNHDIASQSLTSIIICNQRLLLTIKAGSGRPRIRPLTRDLLVGFGVNGPLMGVAILFSLLPKRPSQITIDDWLHDGHSLADKTAT